MANISNFSLLAIKNPLVPRGRVERVEGLVMFHIDPRGRAPDDVAVTPNRQLVGLRAGARVLPLMVSEVCFFFFGRVREAIQRLFPLFHFFAHDFS